MIDKKIKNILDKLNNQGILIETQKTDVFYDEPQSFNYVTRLKISPFLKRKYLVDKKQIIGSASSLTDEKKAIIKSIFEAVERFSLFTYDKNSIKSLKYKDNANFINPNLFSNKTDFQSKYIKWSFCKNLISNEDFLIPSDLVYIWPLNKKENPWFFPLVSTGAAAGVSLNQAIINGIYEIVERDALMVNYLSKITPNRVNLKKLKNAKIDSILERCQRYKIEIYVVDITTDLGIPVYASILIDRTGFGPAVSIGSKSNLNKMDAIIGSITESFMVRTGARLKFKDGSIIEKDNKLVGKDIYSERVALWFLPDSIKNIEFMISGKIVNINKSVKVKEEFTKLIMIFKKKNYDIYSIDISIDELKRLGIFVNKTIIPKLQPLFLKEEEKEKSINSFRIQKFNEFKNKKNFHINSIPHPFP